MSIHIKIPWGNKYVLENLVFDLNGTLANDGEVTEETKKLLKELSNEIIIHVITADTHNTADDLKKELDGIATVMVLQGDDHTTEKAQFVKGLGYRTTAAVGNGANDVKMVEEAILSFGVMGKEGFYAPMLSRVDLLVGHIDVAIEMFLNPMKIVASLRK